jgi:hypothetical protein
MRRLSLAATLAAIIVLLSASAALAPPTNKDELLKDEQRRLQQSQTLYQGGQKAAQAFNMEVVGQHDLGGRGFNADVWAHEGFAYIGHWGLTDWAQGSKTRFCPAPPNNGVAVIDYRDPANPRMVSRLVNPTGTSAEDGWCTPPASAPWPGGTSPLPACRSAAAPDWTRALPGG